MAGVEGHFAVLEVFHRRVATDAKTVKEFTTQEVTTSSHEKLLAKKPFYDLGILRFRDIKSWEALNIPKS